MNDQTNDEIIDELIEIAESPREDKPDVNIRNFNLQFKYDQAKIRQQEIQLRNLLRLGYKKIKNSKYFSRDEKEERIIELFNHYRRDLKELYKQMIKSENIERTYYIIEDAVRVYIIEFGNRFRRKFDVEHVKESGGMTIHWRSDEEYPEESFFDPVLQRNVVNREFADVRKVKELQNDLRKKFTAEYSNFRKKFRNKIFLTTGDDKKGVNSRNENYDYNFSAEYIVKMFLLHIINKYTIEFNIEKLNQYDNDDDDNDDETQ